jgi:hypothetical protein
VINNNEPKSTVVLTEIEHAVLLGALAVWGGPALPTDALARAMGWVDTEDFETDGTRLSLDLQKMQPLSDLDWARALVAAEFALVSSVYGTAGDWEVITSISRSEAFATLPLLQKKLTRLSRAALRAFQEPQ